MACPRVPPKVTRLQSTADNLGYSLKELAWFCWKGSLGGGGRHGRLPYSIVGLSCPSSSGTEVSMAPLRSTQTVALLSQSGICPCVASSAPSLFAEPQLCKGGWSPPHLRLTGACCYTRVNASSIGVLSGSCLCSLPFSVVRRPSGRASRVPS